MSIQTIGISDLGEVLMTHDFDTSNKLLNT